MVQKYKKKYGLILKDNIFISQHFGNPTFPISLTLPDIKHAELIFSIFKILKYGGSEKISLSQGIHEKRVLDNGFLEILEI